MDDDSSPKENDSSTSKKESSKENQPSPSKKESQGNAGYDARDKRRDDRASNSESCTSGYSVWSGMDVANVRPEAPKPPAGKREAKPEKKKRRAPRPRRVEKRRRSVARRQITKRPSKRRPKEKRDRDLSISTIFTRMSSGSGSRTPACMHCGHRCCRRRYEYERRKWTYTKDEKKLRKRKVLKRLKIKSLEDKKNIDRASECVQVGSRAGVLSSLFIKTNIALLSPEAPTTQLPQEQKLHCEITPEMIYESLRRLTMWRQSVATASIQDHMKRNYPVNPDENELITELLEKLRVAVVVGIVTQASVDSWCLNCALQKRKLSKNHVTRFWQIYADTMSAITRKNQMALNSKINKETSTRNTGASLTISDEELWMDMQDGLI